jgi:hypothetical protein
MIDNVWATWQAKEDGRYATQYKREKWEYDQLDEEEPPHLGDQLNEGLDPKPSTGTNNIIPPKTQRDFKLTDWMVFFGKDDGISGAPDYFGPEYFGFTQTENRKEYWTVAQLVNDRHSFRTFQHYDIAEMRKVKKPGGYKL